MFSKDRKGPIEGPTTTKVVTPNGNNGAQRRVSNEGATPSSAEGARKSSSTLDNIQKLEREREQRRVAAAERRADKSAEEKRNAAAGLTGDVDFMRAIRAFRDEAQSPGSGHCARDHTPPGDTKVTICVRKRPINRKEIRKSDHDSVTCLNPKVVVHDCKLRVDGITKYLDNQQFEFDHSFGEDSSTKEVYFYVGQPLVSYVVRGGRATCFAYGQTGSGKTHTMVGIQEMAVNDLFEEMDHFSDLNDVEIFVSFYEIYGGRCQDLLNHRHRLVVREDGKGEVHIAGLQECCVTSGAQLLSLVAKGNQLRTTQATETNDTSSRSHAICQIVLRRAGSGKLHGKLSLVDLAGSERGQDTKSHNRQLRTESAEINKSLLALKECIRGIASNSSHVPFRAAKLTMVLRDSFVRPNSRVAMIATVSPAVSATDHTINTLRYADRVKEKPIGAAAAAAAGANGSNSNNNNGEEQNEFEEWNRRRRQQPTSAGSDSGGDGGYHHHHHQPPQQTSLAEERAALRRGGGGSAAPNGGARGGPFARQLGGRPASSSSSSSSAAAVQQQEQQSRQQSYEAKQQQAARSEEGMGVEEFEGDVDDDLTVDEPLPVAEPRDTAVADMHVRGNGMKVNKYQPEVGVWGDSERTPDQAGAAGGGAAGAAAQNKPSSGRSSSSNGDPASGGSRSSQGSVSATDWERQPAPKRNLFNVPPPSHARPPFSGANEHPPGDPRVRQRLQQEREQRQQRQQQHAKDIKRKQQRQRRQQQQQQQQQQRQPWDSSGITDAPLPPWPASEEKHSWDRAEEKHSWDRGSRSSSSRSSNPLLRNQHDSLPDGRRSNLLPLSTVAESGSPRQEPHTSDKENNEYGRAQGDAGGGGGRSGGGGVSEVEAKQQLAFGEDDQTIGDHETDMAYVQSQALAGEGGADVAELHKTVESLFEEEEALLNLHMNVIQENAELLTEEGRLLQNIQGDEVVDYDIDAYAGRLDQILDRKTELIYTLKEKLRSFRTQLQAEENASQRVQQMPQY